MQGYIVVITRNGSLGGRYPITSTECLFGQSPSCDVRVYVANVARKHCLITALPNERAYICNLSPSNTTLVNGIQIGTTQHELQHADVITVGDRHFRWEYPISSKQKTLARKSEAYDLLKSPTCMVQVPMSVFKKKRHSSPGVLRENKIISITSQDGNEPVAKRRKTLHSVTDLGMENKLAKPVNKQLMAVTQPASSPKSFNTFRVLLKSASKKKSLIPISKTPKPQKKIISSKVQRSKSLSPHKPSPKQKSTIKNSEIPSKKIEQIRKISKLTIPASKLNVKKLSSFTTNRKSISTIPKHTPLKSSPTVHKPRKSFGALGLKIKVSKKSGSPKYSSINTTPKTPKANRKSLSPGKSSSKPQKSGSTVKDNSPVKTPRGKTSMKSQTSPVRKSISPKKFPSPEGSRSISPFKAGTPNKNPRGRPPKTPQASSSTKSLSPVKSPVSKTPEKSPIGRPRKTPKKSLAVESESMNKTSTVRASRNRESASNETLIKTPRGRPPKTPKSSSTTKSLVTETPIKTPRGRPPKTPQSSSSTKSEVTETPIRTPRGRPPKTPQSSSSTKSVVTATPIKTPRGRPPKTPQSSSSTKSVVTATPIKTPRGRPPKTPQSSSSSSSPVKSPSRSPLNTSLVKDVIQISTARKSAKIGTPNKALRGRFPETPQTSLTRKSVSPSKSPSLNSSDRGLSIENNTPGKSPRGTPKTPEMSNLKEASSADEFLSQTNSPVVIETPSKAPRGRPAKSPQASPARESVSPSKTPYLKTSAGDSSIENNSSRGRGRPKIQGSDTASKFSSKSLETSSPVVIETTSNTLKGRHSKTPLSSPIRNLVSPSKSSSLRNTDWNSLFEHNSKKSPRGRPSKTPKILPARKSVSPAKSPSNYDSSMIVLSSEQTSNHKSPTTPQTYTRKSGSPTKSAPQNGSPVCETPGKTPKVSPCKTPQTASVKKDVSPESSEITSSNAQRGRPSKTPQRSPAKILTQDKLFSKSDFPIDQSQETPTFSSVTKSARRSALKSGLSSSKDEMSSNKPLFLKSSSKKAEIEKLQIHSKRKYDTEAEAKAERAAKRLKMETPKSLTKNKKAALLVCHSPKSQKRPLFSEVLKSHLSTIKKNQAASTGYPVVPKRAARQIYKPPISLEVPKSFKFNSTGHANSPETIIIRKTIKKTPLKQKSITLMKNSTIIGEKNSESFSEASKTPKSIISSLKNASSVKKTQNVRVRFSLQNDVQSPSGRRSLVAHNDEVTYFGSPVLPPKKYIGTPRPSMRKFSDASLIHTSIMEESPLAQEISHQGESDKSYDFSVYSPSSPTLQFSRISDNSLDFVRRSIDFTDSPTSESIMESPKRKRSTRSTNDTVLETPPLTKRISFASVSRSRPSSSPTKLRSSSDNGVISPQNSLNTTNISDTSIFSHPSRKSHSKFTNESVTRTSGVSTIPSPDSPLNQSGSASSLRLSSSTQKNNENSVRSTRSSIRSSAGSSSPEYSLTISESKISNQSLDLSQSSDNSISKHPKRISSTPQLRDNSNVTSPTSSPISTFGKRSLRSLELSTPQSFLQESLTTDALTGDQITKSPLRTPGRKSKKSCNLMHASNDEMFTPESQVPVAAVKPSTRRKQGNESYSSASESVSLPVLSVSQDVSGRSVDKSFAQKMLESRASSSLNQSRTSRNSTPSNLLDESNLSYGSTSSSRRKRKSSASTSTLSIDATTFDFTSAMTPKIPREMFVSPLDKASDDLINISGVKQILNPKATSPISSYEDVKGVKKLFKASQPKDDLTDVSGIKRVMSPKANSPISSYIDVRGVKRLLKTPQSESPLVNYASIGGIKELFKNSPVADYTNVTGIKNLYSVSAEPNYMNVRGVRRIFKEAKIPNSPDIAGVEVLFESPKKVMDELNHSSPTKPIGMVPPMSREVPETIPSGDSSTQTVSHEVEQNHSTGNGRSVPSSRRRVIMAQVIDEQRNSKTSLSVRKGRSKNADYQNVSNSVIPIKISENKKTRKVNQSTDNNIEEPRSYGRVSNRNRNQLALLENNEQELTMEKQEMESQVENKGSKTRNRGRPKQPTNENLIKKQVNMPEITVQHTVSNALPENYKKSKEFLKNDVEQKAKDQETLNTDPIIGRKTRQTKTKPNEVEEKVKSSQRVRDPQKQDVVESSRNDNVVIDQDNEKIPASKHGKINVTSITDETTKRNTRKRGETGNKEAMSVESKILVMKSPDISERSEVGKLRRGRSAKTEPLEVKSTINTIKPAKSTSRKRKTDRTPSPTSKLLALEEDSNLRKEDINDNSDVSISEQSTRKTSLPRKEDKKSRRRVQFDMNCSPSRSSTKKRTRKETVKSKATSIDVAREEPAENDSVSLKKQVPVKKVSTKTKATNKLKATPKAMSPTPPQDTPKKKETAKRKTRQAKVSPELETVVMEESPVASTSRRRVPANKVVAKTKASPKLKAAAKVASPTPTQKTPEKQEPTKRKTRQAKDRVASPTPTQKTPEKQEPTKRKTRQAKVSPKLKNDVKVTSPKATKSKRNVPAKTVTTKTKASPKLKEKNKVTSPKATKSKRNVPAKTVTTKTKASPKLKATNKRRSVPEKTSPVKRVTRSRK